MHRVLSQQFRRQCVPLSGGSGRCRATSGRLGRSPVRFAALAASILGNPVRRKDYDVALNPGVGSGPWRLPIGNQEASAGEGSTNSRVLGEGAEVSQLSVDAAPPRRYRCRRPRGTAAGWQNMAVPIDLGWLRGCLFCSGLAAPSCWVSWPAGT